jgi:hypothetical protein
MNDKRIFKACEIDCNKDGWVVDLSPENIVNPDCYWYFKTKKQCEKFLTLIGNGWDNELAYNIIYNPEKVMNIVENLKYFQEENK